MNNDDIQLLWKYFVHRDDTYTTQHQIDRKENGVVVKQDWAFLREKKGWCNHRPFHAPEDCPDITITPLYPRDIEAHLAGEKTLGLYQSYHDTVKWICLDVDIKKHYDPVEYDDAARTHVKRLLYLLSTLDITPLLEYSGSRGFHVWIFFNEAVPLKKAKAFADAVVQKLPEEEGLTVDIYPARHETQRLGSLVKLPLGIHRKTGNRCIFLRPEYGPNGPQDVTFYRVSDSFSYLRTIPRLSKADFEGIIERYDIRPEVIVQDANDSTHSLPCFVDVMENGTVAGHRDAAAFQLAVYLKSTGMPQPLVEATMQEWNATINEGETHERELEQKIRSAFSANYSRYPCMNRDFDPYCKTDCPFYSNKIKRRKDLQ